jgi:hypothetical protein
MLPLSNHLITESESEIWVWVNRNRNDSSQELEDVKSTWLKVHGSDPTRPNVVRLQSALRTTLFLRICFALCSNDIYAVVRSFSTLVHFRLFCAKCTLSCLFLDLNNFENPKTSANTKVGYSRIFFVESRMSSLLQLSDQDTGLGQGWRKLFLRDYLYAIPLQSELFDNRFDCLEFERLLLFFQWITLFWVSFFRQRLHPILLMSNPSSVFLILASSVFWC